MKYRERGIPRRGTNERELIDEATRLLAAAGFDGIVSELIPQSFEVPLNEAVRLARSRESLVMDSLTSWLENDTRERKQRERRRRRGTS